MNSSSKGLAEHRPEITLPVQSVPLDCRECVGRREDLAKVAKSGLIH